MNHEGLATPNDSIASCSRAPAQVRIFEVHEVSFVKAANGGIDGPTASHEHATHPVNFY
jgi:hypothetical protein